VLLVSAAQGSCHPGSSSKSAAEGGDAKTGMDNARMAKLRAYLEEYWDGIDVDTLTDADREQRLVDYIYLTQNADSLTRRMCWQKIAEVFPNQQPNRMVCDYLGESDSPLYAPAMLDEYLETLTTVFDEGSVQRVRVDYLLENLRKNRPGSTIGDLDLVIAADGTRTTLHHLIALCPTDTKVLFYDPECEECAAEISRLSTTSDPVIAVSVTGTALPAAQSGTLPGDRSDTEAAKALPASWHSCIATDMDQLDENYYLPTLPRIFTVTPAGTIRP